MGMTGEEIVYALKKAATWGTSIAAAAGDGVLGLPWAADPANPTVLDDSLGIFFATSSTPGQTKLDATFNSYARYNDEVLLSFLAAWFGTTGGVPTTHTGGTLSKDHILKINKSLDGIFFTLCAKLGTGFVEEIPSWKPAKLVITMESGKPITFAFTGPGIDLVADSAVNTLTTFNSVTILETANRCYFGQSAVWMNNASDIALTSTNKVGPSKIVLTLERKMNGVYGSYVDSGAGRDLIDEPTNDGQPTGTLELTFPRLKDNTGRLLIKNETPQKCSITLTGPIIEGAIPYTMTFTLPNLNPSKNVNPHKHGIIVNTRTYDVLGATSAPAGMTGQTDPIWCALTNKITTDLAA
jgi:hypothetical protein